MKITNTIEQNHPVMLVILEHARRLEGNLSISHTDYAEDGESFDLVAWLEGITPFQLVVTQPEVNVGVDIEVDGDKVFIIPANDKWPEGS